ncbi:hypothetical protein N7534_011677 [Penicillium rubens]|nr:hypothetical protein N7534_011677 [Penicillium rubens]
MAKKGKKDMQPVGLDHATFVTRMFTYAPSHLCLIQTLSLNRILACTTLQASPPPSVYLVFLRSEVDEYDFRRSRIDEFLMEETVLRMKSDELQKA